MMLTVVASAVTWPPSPSARSGGGNPVSPAGPLLAVADAPHRRIPSGEPAGSPEPPPGEVTSSCRGELSLRAHALHDVEEDQAAEDEADRAEQCDRPESLPEIVDRRRLQARPQEVGGPGHEDPARHRLNPAGQDRDGNEDTAEQVEGIAE